MMQGAFNVNSTSVAAWKAMLASIAQALRPRGELVVIDYRRQVGESSPWVLDHVRAGEAQIIEEIEAAGFVRVSSEDFLRENWFARFRKAEKRDKAEGEPRP
jgi:predicted methyltransferase